MWSSFCATGKDGGSFGGVVVFFIREWSGEATETEEMAPRWYNIHELPLQEMWAADGKWLPLILAGETIEAEVRFHADGSALKEFHYKPRIFGEENKEVKTQ